MVHRNYFFLMIGLVATAGLIQTTMALTQTEPSMIIQMLNGQTEKPFRIIDQAENDVFCIETNGLLCNDTWKQFEYENPLGTVLSHTGECTFGNTAYPENVTSPCVLAQIDVTQLDVTKSSWVTLWKDSYLYSDMRRTSGTGNCFLEMWTFDNDDTSYGAFSQSIGTAGASYSPQYDIDDWFSVNRILSLRLVLYTDDGSTSCEYKDASWVMELPKRNDVTYTRTK